MQQTIIEILIEKLKSASKQTGIRQIAISGGVSANSGLRMALKNLEKDGFETFIPKFEYCTDNAAMIAVTGRFLYEENKFSDQSVSAQARLKW